MTAWKVRSLRLTVFLPPETFPLAKALEWEHLVGEKPENVMTRGDRESQDGPFDSGRLLLQKQPGRIDGVLVGFPQGEQQEDPVATLGTFEEAYKAFRPIATKILETVSPQLRIALGTEFVQPVKTVADGYKVLVEH